MKPPPEPPRDRRWLVAVAAFCALAWALVIRTCQEITR